MLIVRILFDDGSTRTFKPHSLRDIDGIEWYINRHPEILHVEILRVGSEVENNDNI